MLSVIPHFLKITNAIFVSRIRKETLLFENGEGIENSELGTKGNDLDSPQLKQCNYL